MATSAGEEAALVVSRLREAGYEALFAGGCVRDLLLGREPHDYDVATSAPVSAVEKLFDRTVSVGAQFGVVKVLGNVGDVEVATFRRDGPYHDSRHPAEVYPADARGDAERRDFTINGMFLDPETGRVDDFVGGRDDLEAGRIRAIGTPAERFGEDRLRLIRAIRFAARFDFEIEAATWASIRELANTITGIAWERIGDEVEKILTEGRAARGLKLLAESGLLAEILPELAAMQGVEQSPEHHPEGDVFVHTCLCLEKIDPARHDAVLAFAVLLHDVAKPPCFERGEDGRIRFHGHCELGAEMALEICRRLRRSGDMGERVAWLVRNHLRPMDASRMRLARLKRFLGEPDIDLLLELLFIDASSGSGDLTDWQFCIDRKAEFSRIELKPSPLLGGRDLIALGLQPGPLFRALLDEALDAQLEGEFVDLEGARRWLSARVEREGRPTR